MHVVAKPEAMRSCAAPVLTRHVRIEKPRRDRIDTDAEAADFAGYPIPVAPTEGGGPCAHAPTVRGAP
jgi:hypothetical protein